MKIEKGDLVSVKNWRRLKQGIVIGDDKDWWVIKGHFDIEDCIVKKTDIVKIIKKKIVGKRYLQSRRMESV